MGLLLWGQSRPVTKRMNWTFYDLYYGAAADVRQTSAAFQTLCKRWANEVVDDFFGLRLWFFATREGNFLTTANVMRYTLPAEMSDIIDARQKRSRNFLNIVSGSIFHQRVPDPEQTGTNPSDMVVYGMTAIYQQPSSTISVVSTSASDTQAITVKGESGGWERSESITATGISAAAGTYRFTRISEADAASAAVGTITIKDDQGNTLATIAIGATAATITAQPSSLLAILSSSDSDTSKKVRIGGYDSAGIYAEETVTMSATTPTTATNSTVSYNRLEFITKENTWTGRLTATSNTANRTNARIAPLVLVDEYLDIGLWRIPSDQFDMFVRYRLHPRKMVNDHDTFFPIPQRYYSTLKEGVMAKAWGYLKNENKQGIAQANYERSIQQAKTDDGSRFPADVVMLADDEYGYGGEVKFPLHVDT